ncbi:SlyX family protein [Ferrimonas lipolytica]|uniref:Protein SlyX homolog n=1 Tax=Ferrimonas lipolytica TaxID=2724191 RepID=A0A6H1UJ75_9GAMM|nr:SlyX family protein [Ferrimonas lipolytica]QIZ77852.1 SlyX family protein [Ferrimonas lipolytica]
MNAEQTTTEINERLIDLETKVSYQDGIIEQLNDTVVELNSMLAKQGEQIRLLAERVKSMPQGNSTDGDDNTPPPHY